MNQPSRADACRRSATSNRAATRPARPPPVAAVGQGARAPPGLPCGGRRDLAPTACGELALHHALVDDDHVLAVGALVLVRRDLRLRPATMAAHPPIGRGDMAYERITADPDQMGGQPCIRGLRIPVATVVAMVADGMTVDEIVAAYPDLEREDVAEALRYAAEALRERELPLRTPA